MLRCIYILSIRGGLIILYQNRLNKQNIKRLSIYAARKHHQQVKQVDVARVRAQQCMYRFIKESILSDIMEYQCKICLISLKRQPKIVVRDKIKYRHSDQGYFNLCTSCFEKWSKNSQLLQLPDTLQYSLIDSKDQIEQNSHSWTIHQVDCLFYCVKKFGFDSWKNIQSQFARMTGKNRIQAQLIKMYQFYYGKYLKQLQSMNFSQKIPVQAILVPKPKCLVSDFDYSRLNASHIAYFEQFNSILNIQQQHQHLRNYPDNYAQAYLQLILQQPTIAQIYNHDGFIQQIPLNQSNKYSLAVKWLKESNQTQYEIKSFNKQMAKEYAFARKRDHRSSRSIHDQRNKPKQQVSVHEEAEVKQLRAFNNEYINTMMSSFSQLKKQRQSLLIEIRAWNKKATEQANYQQP